MPDILDRFSRKLDIVESGCWEWAGGTVKGGYGKIEVEGHTLVAHKVLYELIVEIVPEGYVLDHLCRNSICCNPDHLEITTQKINIFRGSSYIATKMRQTSCVRNHLLSGDNLYLTPDGRRQCRICLAAANKKCRERKDSIA